MKAAILDENNIVTNIAKVADETFAQSQGWVVSGTAKIGDTYDPSTGDFTSPPTQSTPPIASITRRQGKQQLVISNLDDQVDIAINNIQDSKERKLTRIWYDDADTWERDNAQLQSLAQALNLTDEQVDDLFQAASQL